MGTPYIHPELSDITVPDIFTIMARQNSYLPLVQIINEHHNRLPDCNTLTWGQVIQHAQNAAADLRDRWAASQIDGDLKQKNARPREAGSPLVVVGVLAKDGYQSYVNMLACALNRWTILMISQKNSPDAIEHLLRISNSSLFLIESDHIIFGKKLEKTIPGLTAQAVTSLATAAIGTTSSPLSTITQEKVKEEMNLPAFYLHTSGSTGHPKIVAWSHKFVVLGARALRTEGYEWIGRPLYAVVPLAHAIGISQCLICVIAHANIIHFVSSSTSAPPTAISLVSHMPFIQGGTVVTSPFILEDLYNLGPIAVKKVADGTRLVMFAGAPLPVELGDALVAAGLNLITGYGSTETGNCTQFQASKNPYLWQYVRFREGYTWHFLPIDDHSNLRELIVGPGVEECPAVINHANPHGYATNDVWESHPEIPGMWKHHSRKGDVVCDYPFVPRTVLINGEKSDNKQIENLLLKDKSIRFALAFGAGRPMNGVLLQPADLSIPVSTFLLRIQRTIDIANSILPKHSRLIPELILVATLERQFATTDKDTIRKIETLNRFDIDIDAAYRVLSERGLEWTFEGRMDSEEDLKNFVRNAVHNILGKKVADHWDFFGHGLDSLLAIRLRAAVLSVIRHILVPQNVAYAFPSINALTAYLLSCSAPHVVCSPTETREERIRQTISEYSSDFVPHVPGNKFPHNMTVALSGSTGSVGSSLLMLLLEREDVDKIYLLNRTGHEKQTLRQATAVEKRGLDPKNLETKGEKLVYLNVDLSRRDLGLAAQDYEDLRDNVTHIIHAAWNLNFNLMLRSYESVHIAGVRHLIDLALSSPYAKPPRLVFLSSIASVAMFRGPTEEPSVGERGDQVLVPEEPIEDPEIVPDQGYGQSKYVSERVIANAVKFGLRATVVRIGQLSGTTENGAWATTEYIPIMFRSSLALQVIPDDLPPFRWMPSNIAASAILKQSFHESSASLEYFAIENPHPTPWRTVITAFSTLSSKPLHPVSLAEWINHVSESNADPADVPAKKLLEFYKQQQKVGQTVALRWDKSVFVASELDKGPIDGILLKKYIEYQLAHVHK